MSGAWRWSLVAVAALGAATAALPLLLFWSELPDPMAVHWSAQMRPDGAMSKSAAPWPPIVLILGLGIVLAAAASLAALAFAIALQLWRDAQPPAAVPGATASPVPHALASWAGTASNRWLMGVGAYLLVQAFLLQALLPQLRAMPTWLAVHAVAFIVLELFSRIVVTIDARDLTIRYGHLGIWTRRVPLADIAAASSLTLDALAHGGWGYRGALLLFGKASIVVRSGPALRLDLVNGKTLFVTVDDAATGAGMLNALLGRDAGRRVTPG